MQNPHPSLTLRIAIGKGVGFIIGLVGFGATSYLGPDIDVMLPWGVLLWYTTMGGVVGMFGVMTYHPVLHLPLPWWVRSAAVGAWFNFMLVFFAHEKMANVLGRLFGEGSVLTNPFFFVLEGAMIALVMGYLATRFGGEGMKALTEDELSGSAL